MKYIAFFTLIFILQINAQATNRFYYNFTYKADSTSKDLFKELLILDINKDDVKFYMNEFIKIDSINNIQHENISSTSPRSLNLFLKRERNSFENTNYVFVANNYYSFETKEHFDWYITDETKNYEGYSLQKATLKYGKRNWIAWFCPQIIYSEGPYKFRGLPGLIFEIEDDKNNFSFKLINNTIFHDEFNTNNILETNFGKKAIKINFKDYKNLMKNAYNNVYSELRQTNGSWYINTNTSRITNEDKVGLLKQIKIEQENIIKYNNPIELDKIINYRK